MLCGVAAFASMPFALAQVGDGRLDLVVTYSGGTMLSPEARLTVTIHDETSPGAQRRPVAQKVFIMQDPVPLTVQMPYRISDINPDGRYTVTASIEDRGQRRFRTAAPVPVLTRDASSLLTLILVAD